MAKIHFYTSFFFSSVSFSRRHISMSVWYGNYDRNVPSVWPITPWEYFLYGSVLFGNEEMKRRARQVHQARQEGGDTATLRVCKEKLWFTELSYHSNWPWNWKSFTEQSFLEYTSCGSARGSPSCWSAVDLTCGPSVSSMRLKSWGLT